ncbi:MAG: transporter [Candidatus Sericytochromatia bacterium]|nr:MAG: transporter [Candidatus Sericytochromatia bacterium]
MRKIKNFILITWIFLILISLLSINVIKRENYQIELDGVRNTQAYKVSKILENEFNIKLGNSCAIAIDSKSIKLDNLINKLKSIKEIENIREIKSNKNHNTKILFIDFKKEFSFLYIQNLTPNIRNIVKQWSLDNKINAYVTGNSAFQYDINTFGKKDASKGEKFALVIALIILIYNFGSIVSSLIPLIIGASTLILLKAIIKIFYLPVNPISMILTSLIGLALAIDYSLFILSRYKEEYEITNNSEISIKKTIKSVGKTIFFSALIMLCAISALLIPDLTLSRIVVLNIMLVILLTLINSLIFLPFLILGLNRYLDIPKFLNNLLKKYHEKNKLRWQYFSKHIVNNSKLYFLLSFLMLIILTFPLKNIKLWEPVQALTPSESESMKGYNLLKRDLWGGELVPVIVIVNSNKKNGIYEKSFIEFIYKLTKDLKNKDYISDVQSLTSWKNDFTSEDFYKFYSSIFLLFALNQNNNNPFINKDASLTIVNIFPKDIMNLEYTNKIIDFLSNYHLGNQKYEILIGGIVPRIKDFTKELYSYIPEMLLIIFLGIYILLFLYMKSIVLPIKATIMNFLPILASFGILVLIFQYGYLSDILNTPINNAITNIVPIILFCIIFGLSMDYEVLILSRISEEYYKTNDVKESIINGLSKISSLITGAVLILIGVFIPSIFSTSPQTKEISIGIISALILDATLVRLLLVPSFMFIMGKWNWYNPFKKLN